MSDDTPPPEEDIVGYAIVEALLGVAQDGHPLMFFVSLEPLGQSGRKSVYHLFTDALELAWMLSLACAQPCEVRMDPWDKRICTITREPARFDRELLAIMFDAAFPHIDLAQVAPDLKPLLDRAIQAGRYKREYPTRKRARPRLH